MQRSLYYSTGACCGHIGHQYFSKPHLVSRVVSLLLILILALVKPWFRLLSLFESEKKTKYVMLFELPQRVGGNERKKKNILCFWPNNTLNVCSFTDIFFLSWAYMH